MEWIDRLCETYSWCMIVWRNVCPLFWEPISVNWTHPCGATSSSVLILAPHGLRKLNLTCILCWNTYGVNISYLGWVTLIQRSHSVWSKHLLLLHMDLPILNDAPRGMAGIFWLLIVFQVRHTAQDTSYTYYINQQGSSTWSIINIEKSHNFCGMECSKADEPDMGSDLM